MAASNRAAVPELLVVVHNQSMQEKKTPGAWKHACHHLSIILHGEGLYRNGPAELPPERPLFGFLPAGDDDFNGFVGRIDAWYAGFHWPGLSSQGAGKLELDVSWNGRAMRIPRFKAIVAAAAPRIVEQYQAMRAALARNDLAGSMLAQGLLTELFAMYVDLPSESGAPASHRALSRFQDLLRVHACDDVSIEELADRAGLTADHLRDLFRERFGQRPIEYRTGLRMGRARELLASTTLNVKEVARRTGYPDALYFSRAFRRHFSINPREMIRRHRLAMR
ncbi:MAG: helix-turn-helix transcriptional regulator [Planctomycetes bacterium]|nr:helix-turn-helix transcriptional regulator [Planctomycetota bacterium]